MLGIAERVAPGLAPDALRPPWTRRRRETRRGAAGASVRRDQSFAARWKKYPRRPLCGPKVGMSSPVAAILGRNAIEEKEPRRPERIKGRHSAGVSDPTPAGVSRRRVLVHRATARGR